MLPLDRLVGELAEACRHEENHAFLKPFLETAISVINKSEGAKNTEQQVQQDGTDKPLAG